MRNVTSEVRMLCMVFHRRRIRSRGRSMFRRKMITWSMCFSASGEQTLLEVSSGDSVLTAPSMIRTWKYRPFFWRQELPGTLHLRAGVNEIILRLPDAKPAPASTGNGVRRSVRFGQGVTEEFHLFSIELGTAAARQAQVQRATAIRGDASWMIDGKYGIFVHWSSQSRGFTID